MELTTEFSSPKARMDLRRRMLYPPELRRQNSGPGTGHTAADTMLSIPVSGLKIKHKTAVRGQKTAGFSGENPAKKCTGLQNNGQSVK